MDAESWSIASGGTCQLIRLPDASPLLPNATNRFLISIGLPSHLIFESESAFEIRFAALAKPLVAYNSLVKWGDFYDAELDQRWATRIVIGYEEFCNGTACHCVDSDTGHIVRTDCELSDPECFVNSSVEHFAACALAAIEWTHLGAHDPSELQSRFREIDPPSVTDENAYWPNLFFTAEDYDQLLWRISCDPSKSEGRF